MENKQLINIWHDKNNNVVLKTIDKQTGKIELSVGKYPGIFYIKPEDVDKAMQVLNDFVVVNSFNGNTAKINFNFIKKEKFCRVEYGLTTVVWFKELIDKIQDRLEENSIEHFETDLMPASNFILNNNIEISDKYRILYFDIETKDVQGGVEIGRDRILSICAVDNTGKEFEFCYDDEIRILNEFVKLLKNYDVITGWNSSHFDIPYIVARCKIHNIYFSKKDPIHIDLMKVFMGSFAVSHTQGKRYITSYSLDNIAKIFINDKKLEIKSGGEGYGGRLWKLFNEDRKTLIEYNLQDCKLLKRLDEEFNLIKNEIEVARIAMTPLSNTRSINSTMDFVILREARKEGLHFKSRPRNATRALYEGAYVVEPEPNLYENINIYDFASLYPNLYISLNISPDTILDKKEEDCITTPNGIHYRQEMGLLPRILEKLVKLRYKYKDEQVKLKKEGKDSEAYIKEFQQTAVKIVILEMYGTTGSSFSRFFDKRIAESITLGGQALLKNIEKELNKNEFKVVGGDTDSIFVQINNEDKRPEVEKIMKETIDRIMKECNVKKQHSLEMNHEKTLSKFIVLAKKKYVGRCIWDDGKEVDELYFRGLELHKGSEILATKELLKHILHSIFYDNFNEEDIEKIIRNYRSKIIKHEIKDVNELTIIKKIGKMPEEYKNLPKHVELAMKRKEKGDLYFIGKRIPHIVLSDKPLTIIHQEDFVGEYDEQYYWENQIYPPTYRLLEVVYPKFNWDKYKEGTPDIQETLF